MVALKRTPIEGRGYRNNRKQERRGGIETHPAGQGEDDVGRRSRNAVVALKRLLSRPDGGSSPRSRNAVVALKQLLRAERELRQLGSRNAVVALKRDLERIRGHGLVAKQERRGGIETIEEARDEQDAEREAGTPWWH